jgi:hypothetical protein
MESLIVYLTAGVLLWMVEEDRKSCENLWGSTCLKCKKGVRHWGRWEAKGTLPDEFDPPAEFWFRFSLCCSNREWRKRCTPASIRFPAKGNSTTGILLLVRLMRAPGSARLADRFSARPCRSTPGLAGAGVWGPPH